MFRYFASEVMLQFQEITLKIEKIVGQYIYKDI